MSERVGQQLGNYRIVRLLGQGGFAEVYLGEHIHLSTQAAIKILYTRLATNEIERFRAEARIIARLEHPNIVRVLEFGVEGTVPFLVMSYAPNGTLRDRHAKGQLVPLATVVQYVKQVGEALQYAHEEKVIHRDVKPENMLVGRRNEIVLSDFGIAVVAQTSRSQQQSDAAGTIAYMAPEQIQTQPRPASDQYALAVVVYEWLSGTCPFTGSFTEVAAKHALVAPPPLRGKAPNVPSAVEEVVMTALAKDPRQRFGSMRAFANALEQASQLSTSTPISPSVVAALSPQTPPLDTPSNPIAFYGDATTPSNSVPLSTPVQPPSTRFSAGSDRDTPAPLPRPVRIEKRNSPARRNLLLLLGPLVAAVLIGGILLSSVRTSRSLTASLPPASPATPPASSSLPPTGYTMFGFDPEHTHFNPDEHILSPANVSHLVVDWAVSTMGKTFSSPAVVNGVVYIGSPNGKLYAFNAATGKLLWGASIGGQTASSPAVANGVVYIGSQNSELYAFNATTGKPLWTAMTGASITFSSPAVANGIVYIGSEDSQLHAFDATTGKPLWASFTGDATWSSPAVANGIVYIGSFDHMLHAFNASTGAPVWAAPTGDTIFSSPAVANGVVYVGSRDHMLHAFDAATGKALWTAPTGNIIESSPAVANGVVYVGSWDHTSYAFDASTGKSLWTTPTGDLIESSPTIANGVVYVGSNDHKLYAFAATTGAILWTASTGGGISSSPAVANGVVYVASTDGKLYAFHLP